MPLQNRLKSFAYARIYFLASSQYSHQLDIAGHVMGSKRPGKTEDCGALKVPPEEAFGWGGNILHVWSGWNAQWVKSTPHSERCGALHTST